MDRDPSMPVPHARTIVVRHTLSVAPVWVWACVYGGAGVVGGSELWLTGSESWALGLMHRAGLTRGGPSWHWVDGGFSPLLCRLPFMAVARIRCFSCAGLCALHCPPRVWRLRAHWLCCSLGTVASARAPFPTSLGTLLSSRSQIWSRSSLLGDRLSREM